MRLPRASGEALLVLPCAGLALWIYRAAPGLFFSPDDLTYLERAQGLIPHTPLPWRALSGAFYFQVKVFLESACDCDPAADPLGSPATVFRRRPQSGQ